MGRFIVSRTAAGVRFLLQSEKGRALALSKEYATLDACKKGICSLVYYAPIIPVIDLSRGESAPNPKFEMDFDGESFSYAMKSANGKSVITADGFATRKACLRAISMLRGGVLGAEVVLSNPAGYTRLTVGGMVRDTLPVAPLVDEVAFAEEPLPEPEEALTATEESASTAAEVVLQEPTAPAAEEIQPAPDAAQPAAASPAHRVPRRVQLPGEPVVRRESETPAKPAPEPAKNTVGRFFKRFFGR